MAKEEGIFDTLKKYLQREDQYEADENHYHNRQTPFSTDAIAKIISLTAKY